MPTTGATGTSPFVAGDVVFRPSEFTSAITNDWTTVPWCNTDFAPYGNTATDHLVTIHNPATGIGDICRYMGDVDGATWRMPTAAEWAELYGSPNQDGADAKILGPKEWIEGNYYQLRGRAMGPNQNSAAITGNDTDARVANADPNTDGALFLPTSGLRHPTAGAIWWIGSGGCYWSSTTCSATNGYYISFNSLSVVPQQDNFRLYGFAIRCIRE